MSTSDKPFGVPGASEDESAASEQDEIEATRAANRFDIRRLIGGLFAIYGVVLTIVGLVGSSHVKNKADGINIDLWTGIALLVFAIVMLAWALLRPVMPEPPEERGQGSGRLRRAPAT